MMHTKYEPSSRVDVGFVPAKHQLTDARVAEVRDALGLRPATSEEAWGWLGSKRCGVDPMRGWERQCVGLYESDGIRAAFYLRAFMGGLTLAIASECPWSFTIAERELGERPETEVRDELLAQIKNKPNWA